MTNTVEKVMGATSEAELTQRIAQVAEWMMVPYTSGEIVRLCRAEWDVNRATSCRYIADANKLIAEEVTEDVGAEIRKAKTRLERITRKAEEDKEYQASIAAQRELNRLMGLAAPEKQEVKHDVSDEFVGIFRGIVKATDKPA